MAVITKDSVKKDLLGRLKTVKGHIGGIEKMVDEEKDCVDILVQVSAIKSSINKIGLSIIENNACECIADSIEEGGKVEESVKEVLDTILKFTK
ncbi:metal-sensitive transcriptional regulator [Halonatronum saccharophilum]|uniref:metal-sensitive transcriptional regulator n=1 Tax=Halonatronum saccharophilum TaxID=150060 RepID=UPI00048912D5|nr:metal-sensitive transcriptional regulator [Halonatronum saccharophilum]